MITHRTMTAEEQSDTELVSRSLAGDRDAFSRIVSRYQTLICSLAYSRIGNLGQSEDALRLWGSGHRARERWRYRDWLDALGWRGDWTFRARWIRGRRVGIR